MVNWDDYGDKRLLSRNRLLFPEHRLTAEAFIYYFKDLDTNLSILDAGCGDGFWMETLRNLGFSNITGIDLSFSLLLRARSKGFSVAQYDISQMAFNYQFDIVILCDVLEHLPDIHGAMNCIYDSLKESGILYLIVPVYDSLASRYQRLVHRTSKIDQAQKHDETHIHAFSKRELFPLLNSHNFQIEKAIYTANRLPFVTGKIQRYTLGNRFGNWLSIAARRRDE